MKFELRNLAVNEALSEDSVCYSAEVWIDGVQAFLASNHGQGAGDDFRQVGPYSIAEVDAWLDANRPPVRAYGVTLQPNLELEIGDLMQLAEQAELLKRSLQTNIVTIEHEAVYTYPLHGRDPRHIAAAIKRRKPDATIIDPADKAVFDHAVRLLVATTRSAEDDTAAA